MFSRAYRRAWVKGFIDGERGSPHQTCKGIAGIRYTSGWIEGRAKCNGHPYGLGDVSEQELSEVRGNTANRKIYAWESGLYTT
ncbi:MAG: hypothetical protein R6U30_07515 [Halomonas sp.]|uniref:hypothetical protein n=1 Tax=Halomonas sp. TaxID=1486246 RepID=UPI0039708D5B